MNAMLLQLCELYNMALQQKRDVWKSHRKLITFNDHCKQLTELRAGVEEYRQFCVAIQRDPLRRVDLAFRAFFRRTRAREAPGYPRFRSSDRYDSFIVCKERFSYESGTVRISGLGTYKTKTGFRIKGKPVELQIKRCGSKWIAKLVCDIGDAPPKKAVSRSIGIDMGISTLVTLSDGAEIANPRWTSREKSKLDRASRSFSRKKLGSKNRNKAKERLRRAHQRIRGKRSSYLHDVSAYLVGCYDFIAYEDLGVQKMIQSSRAISIMDAAWGQLIRQLVYKAEWAGKYAVAVNPHNTTKICSNCGTIVPKTLLQRQHDCSDCGLSLGRDHNAALNILTRGMRVATMEAEYAG
jgi:putative transposase